MRLIAYATSERRLAIEPAPVQRDWMDRTDERFAYRCLPLTIANAHGWQLLNPTAFRASWNGDDSTDGLKIRKRGRGKPIVRSHFGHGILTFGTGYVFRTEPGWSLFVMPPPNLVKDGIQGFCGVVETDWLPYPFTMNWRFTAPGRTVEFAEGEPFCFIFPVPRAVVDSVEPEIRPISDDPALEAAYTAWAEARTRFIRTRRMSGEHWQKYYHRGVFPDGTPAPCDHVTRSRPKPFQVLEGSPEVWEG